VLPSRVFSLCVSDTAIRRAWYYTANILVWVGLTARQQRDMDIILDEWMTEWMAVYVARHRALCYYLMSARLPVQAMKTWQTVFTWERNLQAIISLAFMAVNHNLRSMTIRLPDRDPRYAIQKS